MGHGRRRTHRQPVVWHRDYVNKFHHPTLFLPPSPATPSSCQCSFGQSPLKTRRWGRGLKQPRRWATEQDEEWIWRGRALSSLCPILQRTFHRDLWPLLSPISLVESSKATCHSNHSRLLNSSSSRTGDKGRGHIIEA